MAEITKKVNDNKAVTILSYIGILVLIPLLTVKEDEFVQFHAKQGLVLLIVLIAISMVGVIPVLGPMIGLLGWLACLVLAVMGIMNVLNGEKKPLPFIGQFADKFNF